ncbi:MAG: hypothetical protein ACI9OJ_004316 [Myxococcota bacterium]|jgi:hypothetical protein
MTDVDVWEKLSVENGATAGFSRIRVAGEGSWGLFAARQQPDGRLALLLDLPTSALKRTRADFGRSRGLEVRVDTLESGPSGTVRVVVIVGAPEFRSVFVILAGEIISEIRKCESAERALIALLSQLTRWKRFLERFGARGLGDDAQVGLYGELLTVIELAEMVGMSAAVRAWRGPGGSPQDFEMGDIALEVKATRGGPPHVLRISSVKQLDPPDGIQVFVRHVQLDRRRGSEATLPALVEALRAAVDEASPASRPELEARLHDVGYLDAHSGDYGDVEYKPLKATLYEVRESFPRLRRSELPDGVGDVQYGLQLGACGDFKVGRDTLADRISEDSNSDG